MRINCAHDDAEVWQKMISNVRAAARACGRQCRILMDLSGPRARTEEVLIPKSEAAFTWTSGCSLHATDSWPSGNSVFRPGARSAAVFPALKPGSRRFVQ